MIDARQNCDTWNSFILICFCGVCMLLLPMNFYGREQVSSNSHLKVRFVDDSSYAFITTRTRSLSSFSVSCFRK